MSNDLVRECLAINRPGRYQILAAINAVHTDAPTASDTDWSQVVALYDRLTRLDRFLREVVEGPVVLVGNSMGGMISLFQSARSPQRVSGTVLLDPAVVDPNLGWRLAFGVGGALSLVILLLRQFLTESPRWLMTHGRVTEAEAIVAGIEARVAAERHVGGRISRSRRSLAASSLSVALISAAVGFRPVRPRASIAPAAPSGRPIHFLPSGRRNASPAGYQPPYFLPM